MGSNLFFDSAGAVLDVVGVDVDERLLEGWRRRVERVRAALGWPSRGGRAPATTRSPHARGRARSLAIRRHDTGVLLAVAAPLDQLYTATEINSGRFARHATDAARWAYLEQASSTRTAADDASEGLDSNASTGDATLKRRSPHRSRLWHCPCSTMRLRSKGSLASRRSRHVRSCGR
jgi:hypothetical protein